jgi:hypothetical protein
VSIESVCHTQQSTTTLPASAHGEASSVDTPKPRTERLSLIRVIEYLIVGSALVALGQAATHIYTTLTGPQPHLPTLPVLASLLAVLAGSLALGGGTWDAWQAKLQGREQHGGRLKDRWLTVIGAIVLLGGAVAQLAITAAMTKADATTATTRSAETP